MIIALPETTTAKISSALLRARRNAGSPAMGMVLTLLVVCDEKDYEGALEAARGPVGSTRPGSCSSSPPGWRQAGLDAELRLGEGTPGEVVVMRMRGAAVAHPASVIRPLLLPDSPVVIWWPGKAPAQGADDKLASLSGTSGHQRRGREATAGRSFKARALDYQPGDTDLAWTRLTRWRALLAAALDQYPARINGATVKVERNSPSPTCSRPGCSPA